jgi:hypothetical protein
MGTLLVAPGLVITPIYAQQASPSTSPEASLEAPPARHLVLRRFVAEPLGHALHRLLRLLAPDDNDRAEGPITPLLSRSRSGIPDTSARLPSHGTSVVKQAFGGGVGGPIFVSK